MVTLIGGVIRGSIGRETQSCASMEHLTTDEMEEYYLGRIVAESDLARIEEHLLWCHHCLERVEAVERFIDMVRSGAVMGGFDRNVV